MSNQKQNWAMNKTEGQALIFATCARAKPVPKIRDAHADGRRAVPKMQMNQWQLSSSASIACDDEGLAKASEGKGRQKMQLQTRMASHKKTTVGASARSHHSVFFFSSSLAVDALWHGPDNDISSEKSSTQRNWPVPVKKANHHIQQHNPNQDDPQIPQLDLRFVSKAAK